MAKKMTNPRLRIFQHTFLAPCPIPCDGTGIFTYIFSLIFLMANYVGKNIPYMDPAWDVEWNIFADL